MRLNISNILGNLLRELQNFLARMFSQRSKPQTTHSKLPTTATHHGGRSWPYLPNYWELHLPPAATAPPGPNANIRYTAGVIAASASADFAPPSPTQPNTNIFNSSTSAGRFSTNSASAPTPQHPITRDDDGGGIERVSG